MSVRTTYQFFYHSSSYPFQDWFYQQVDDIGASGHDVFSCYSTSAVSSTSQFSAETLLAMVEWPSTSLSQPVGVIPETQEYSRDFEVIIPSEDPTV